MRWFLSHISLFGLVGVALIILSAVRLTWPKKVIFWPGLVLCGVALIGLWRIAILPPGLEDAIDVGNRSKPTPEPVGVPESLRLAWDSSSYPNWPVASVLASVSEKAYLTPVEAKVSYRTMGFDAPETFTHASLVGYVISSDDATVIVFRGTDDYADWFVNLDAVACPTQHGEAHKGFFGSYQRLKSQIVALVDERKPKHLWITGHSLGGALALVCAYDFTVSKRYHIDGAITFGQPMVAHRELAEYLGRALSGRYAHFVNDQDIVPRVAPGYAHCGSLVWFTPSGIKQSKPKRRTVGATGSERTPPLVKAPRPLSDEEFEHIRTNLQRVEASGGKRQMVGATRAPEVTSIDETDLASFSDEQFKKVKSGLREEKAPTGKASDGRPIMKGNVPWLRDHSMSLYVKKVRDLCGETLDHSGHD